MKSVEVGGIWLRVGTNKSATTPGFNIEVLAEVEGRWVCVIHDRQYIDSGPISHIVEPGGIMSAEQDPVTA